MTVGSSTIDSVGISSLDSGSRCTTGKFALSIIGMGKYDFV